MHKPPGRRKHRFHLPQDKISEDKAFKKAFSSELSADRFSQNFPPPPPWVVPDEETWVLLPEEELSSSLGRSRRSR